MKKYQARIIKNIISSILVVLILFCFFIALVNFSFKLLYIKTHVSGFSMQPTININMTDSSADGDKIFINKYASFTNNDIVVAKVDWHEKYIIKRVVGVPGDKIEIKDLTTEYGVFVNNELLYTKEKYGENHHLSYSGSIGYFEIYKNFLTKPEFEKWVKTENGTTFIQLGENDYFLMGDNWGHTTDSLSKGPVKTNEIIGKVDLIVDVKNDDPLTELKFYFKKLFSIN